MWNAAVRAAHTLGGGRSAARRSLPRVDAPLALQPVGWNARMGGERGEGCAANCGGCVLSGRLVARVDLLKTDQLAGKNDPRAAQLGRSPAAERRCCCKCIDVCTLAAWVRYGRAAVGIEAGESGGKRVREQACMFASLSLLSPSPFFLTRALAPPKAVRGSARVTVPYLSRHGEYRAHH